MDSKVCSKCKVNKSLALFNKRNDRPCGYMAACKDCRKKLSSFSPAKTLEASRLYQSKNREMIKLKQQQKRNDPLFVENERARARVKYAQNPQAHIEKVKQWKTNNPEKAKELRLVSWEKNPGSRNAARAKRHAAKLQATPKWADSAQIVRIYKEAKIKSQQTGEPWEVDHIIPLQSDLVCGLHVEYNLAVIPKIDNMIKGNRLVI